MARRYVAETSYLSLGEVLQKVTVYPLEINKKQLEKELGPLTVKKGILIKKGEQWEYEEVE